jgi:rRNA maturation RNase YbeY
LGAALGPEHQQVRETEARFADGARQQRGAGAVSLTRSIRYDRGVPVEIVRRDGGKKFPRRKLKATALAILQLVREEEAELSIALVGDAEMQKLNADYRQKNYPTDVLSFPVDENLPIKPRLLGDVIISVDKARRQAKERGKTLDQEMTTLLIHGVLHLLGYDHERSAKEARRMRRLEKKVYGALCANGGIRV